VETIYRERGGVGCFDDNNVGVWVIVVCTTFVRPWHGERLGNNAARDGGDNRSSGVWVLIDGFQIGVYLLVREGKSSLGVDDNAACVFRMCICAVSKDEGSYDIYCDLRSC